MSLSACGGGGDEAAGDPGGGGGQQQPGFLTVAPAEDFSSAGPQGGPFFPASKAYTLRNTGELTLEWAVATPAPGIDFSSPGGLLDGGNETVLVVSLDMALMAPLPQGDYHTHIEFLNLTSGAGDSLVLLNLLVHEPGSIAVSPPEPFQPIGFQGGPFEPAEKVYTLSNTGPDPVRWQVSSDQTWIALGPGTGILEPGQAVEVTASLNAQAAAGLAPALHDASLTFENLDEEVAVLVDVTLAVLPRAELAVEPATDFATSGPAAGPFAPASKSYTLKNLGAEPLGWSAAASAPWVQLSAASGVLGVGEETQLGVSIDPAHSSSLAPGNHGATVALTNLTNGLGNGSFGVALQVLQPGVLAVTPQGGLETAGHPGGPFAPSSKIYSLANAGELALDWTASVDQGWVSLSHSSGHLAPGAEVQLEVTIDEAATAALGAGLKLAEVEFRNATTGAGSQTRQVKLNLTLPGMLQVSPSGDLTSAGPAGGPFSPPSKTYTLSNGGGEPLGWTAAVDQSWVELSQTSGVLAPGAQTSVTVTLVDALTASLSPGPLHVASIAFGDLASGASLTLHANLTILTPAAMGVSPTGPLVTSGLAGGPFTPGSKGYTVSNPGTQPMSWAASADQGWVQLSKSGGTLAGGASESLVVSIDAAATAALSEGLHAASVGVVNLTNGNGNANLAVSLDVLTPATLAVSPTSPLTVSGLPGGPFTPSSADYTVTNTGDVALGWTVSVNQGWVNLSQSGGTLAPGQQRVLHLSIDAAATAALGFGAHLASVSFANTTSGLGNQNLAVDLELLVPPTLAVSPAGGLATSGLAGGPFAPDSKTYTLQNAGQLPLTWSASASQGWAQLSKTGGSLAPGAQTSLVVSIADGATAGLAPALYAASVSLANLDGGLGDTSLPLSLEILQPAQLVVNPTSGYSTAGAPGGPFSPGSKTYTVSNQGGQPLTWSAAADQGWVQLGKLGGTLSPGAQDTVVVSIDAAASGSLSDGSYPATVSFTNLDNGNGDTQTSVVLGIVSPPSQLAISPATGFSSSGPDGGPYAPTSKAYTVTNTGGQTLNWAAAATVSWISLTGLGGLLAPGAQATVVVQLETAGPGGVDALALGSHAGQLVFTNLDNGNGNGSLPLSFDKVSASTTPPTLTPGSGFSGSTSEPGPTGSGPGADAKIIANWDAVPYQDVGSAFELGVVAFHRSGVDRVEFSVEGGPWAAATDRIYNPRTQVNEHWVVLDPAQFSSAGLVEVRAIAYPTVGWPRLLTGMYLNVFPGGVPPPTVMWCSPAGNDYGGDGSEQSPYKTIGKAARRITELKGSSDGGVVTCKAGDYQLEPPPSGTVVTNQRWVTVRPAPGLGQGDVRIVKSVSPGLNTKLVHLEGLKVKNILLGSSGSTGDRYLWSEDCHYEGNGQYTSVHSVGWLYGFTRMYWVDTKISDNQLGPTNGSLHRGCDIERIGEDVFRAGSGVILNCEVRDVDRGPVSTWHSDLFEFAASGGNKIIYGVRCTNINAQGIYFKGNTVPQKSGYAFVNLLIENDGGHISQLDGDQMDHLLLWHCTLEQRLVFRSDVLSNLSVKGSSFLDVDGTSPSYSAGVGAPNEGTLEAAGDWSFNHFVNSAGSFTPGAPLTTGSAGFSDPGADDYTPGAGSVLKNKLQPLVPFDLTATPRSSPTSVGAFE